MKKTVLFTSIALILCSCSKNDNLESETNNSGIENQKVLIVNKSDVKNYIFEGKNYESKFIENIVANNKAVNEQDENLVKALNSEELNIYYNGTDTARLFKNSVDLLTYIQKNHAKSNNLSVSKQASFDGVAVCWEHYSYQGNQLYFREYQNPQGWEFISTLPYPGGGTWDNRISSIRVNNGAMAFYGNASFATGTFNPGYTLVVHDPNNDPTQAVSLGALFFQWNNSISESRWLLTQ